MYCTDCAVLILALTLATLDILRQIACLSECFRTEYSPAISILDMSEKGSWVENDDLDRYELM